MSQKTETFHIRWLYYIVFNTAKSLGSGVTLGARGRPIHGLKRQNSNKLSPDKSMMPLSYDLEILPEYLVPKRKLQPQISAS